MGSIILINDNDMSHNFLVMWHTVFNKKEKKVVIYRRYCFGTIS
jgi:hypothetical protein